MVFGSGRPVKEVLSCEHTLTVQEVEVIYECPWSTPSLDDWTEQGDGITTRLLLLCLTTTQYNLLQSETTLLV